MIDTSLSGVRCRAAQDIVDCAGTIDALTEGTIVYELEGPVGQLLNVCWDNGQSSFVAAEKVEIADAEITWQ